MLVVNLFGAPGAGKSTGAAYIFSQLKMLGINAELVTEFAKDMVWCNNQEALSNQAYMFGQQLYRISRLEDKVDVVITDSPVFLSAIYNRMSYRKLAFALGEDFEKLVAKISKSYPSLNFFINRVKPYNKAGRLQTEKESNSIETEIVDMLRKHDIEFYGVLGDENGYEFMLSTIKERLLNMKRDKEEIGGKHN